MENGPYQTEKVSHIFHPTQLIDRILSFLLGLLTLDCEIPRDLGGCSLRREGFGERSDITGV